MAGRRGRPRADRVRNVEQVADLLAGDPNMSASTVARVARIRKAEAVRIVRLIRALVTRFPKSESDA